jgi:hypothetical protein
MEKYEKDWGLTQPFFKEVTLFTHTSSERSVSRMID